MSSLPHKVLSELKMALFCCPPSTVVTYALKVKEFKALKSNKNKTENHPKTHATPRQQLLVFS